MYADVRAYYRCGHVFMTHFPRAFTNIQPQLSDNDGIHAALSRFLSGPPSEKVATITFVNTYRRGGSVAPRVSLLTVKINLMAIAILLLINNSSF